MKFSFFYLVISFLILSCQTDNTTNETNLPTALNIVSLDTFPIPASVRALEVVNDSTVWFAGSEGVYGYTKNGGQSWHIDSLQWDTLQPHFRSISVTEDAVYLLSIASPALLFRSKDEGQSWRLVYKEESPAAFYDAMTFWDTKTGIAMGDPTDGCLSVIRTRDGGAYLEKNRLWSTPSCG